MHAWPLLPPPERLAENRPGPHRWFCPNTGIPLHFPFNLNISWFTSLEVLPSPASLGPGGADHSGGVPQGGGPGGSTPVLLSGVPSPADLQACPRGETVEVTRHSRHSSGWGFFLRFHPVGPQDTGQRGTPVHRQDPKC